MTGKVPSAPRNTGPRLFVEGLCVSEGCSVALSRDESHYLRHVLRLRVGDQFQLGGKDGGALFEATITDVSDAVTVEIGTRLSTRTEGRRRLTLLFALCKGTKNDLVCDWATELGCARIIFWQAERSVVRLRSPDEIETKRARLLKIAQAAAQQSKQDAPPHVDVVQTLDQALALIQEAPRSLQLSCSLSPLASPIASHVAGSSEPITIVIGPEGDVSPDEEALLASRGFTPVSLGSEVLRSELAAVSALVACRLT